MGFSDLDELKLQLSGLRRPQPLQLPPKIRDVLRWLRDDGWYVDRTRTIHRQLRHPSKSGVVTLTGKDWGEVKVGTLKSILKQARL